MTQMEEPLYRHITALRQLLIRSFTTVLLLLVITGYFSKDLYAILAEPLVGVLPPGSHFITTHPIEAWYTYFKTALFTALFLATPIIFFEIWRFIVPGLHRSEKKIFLGAVLSSSTLFLVGGIFGYFIAFPFGLHYFTNVLNGTDILFLPRMEDYLGFAFQMLIAFGIIFEIPLFLILLSLMGLVSSHKLSLFRRYYVVLAFIIAAILTPPDMISQIMMGIPMLLLYEAGVAGVWLIERKRVQKEIATSY
jgi:sec-independent protein translocase protein TatC